MPERCAGRCACQGTHLLHWLQAFKTIEHLLENVFAGSCNMPGRYAAHHACQDTHPLLWLQAV